MDSALIEQAKLYAQVHEVSLSQLVAEYFALLVTADEDKGSFRDSLPPITRPVLGILDESALDLEDYHRYLEEKYGESFVREHRQPLSPLCGNRG